MRRFMAMAFLLSSIAFGGGSDCCFERLGTTTGIFDRMAQQVVDRGLRSWHSRNQNNLNNWQTISDAQVLRTKLDLLDAIGAPDHPAEDLRIGVNGDGTYTIQFSSDGSRYLFTP